MSPIPAHALLLAGAPAAAAWTPASLPSLAGWWDASNAGSITASSGRVSQLNDLSGLGKHMTQATGANQPLTGSHTVNSLNAIFFDGSRQLVSTIPSNFTNVSVFAVFKITSIGTRNYFGSDAFDAFAWDTNSGAQRLLYQNTALIATANTSVTAAAHCVAVQRTNGTNGAWAFFLDGAADGSGTATADWSSRSGARLALGAQAGVAAGFVGDFCEGFLATAISSASDITSACAYLKAKWATP